MPNTLVTTLGTSWAIVPELIGFTNFQTFELFKNHPLKNYFKKRGIEPIDTIYIVTTDSKETKSAIDNIEKWNNLIKTPLDIKYVIAKNINDMSSIEECKKVGNLIYQTVLTAKINLDNKKLYLSLAGGRKTMSADMQQAAYFFGCDALLHIAISTNEAGRQLSSLSKPEDWIRTLDKDTTKNIIPIIISEKIEESSIIQTDRRIIQNNILDTSKQKHETSFSLYEELQNLRKQASSLLVNYISHLSEKQQTSAFRLLYSLSPSIIERLQQEKIALDISKKQEDLEWVKSLPKTELHCHMGGILTPEEIIQVSKDILSTDKAKNILTIPECNKLINLTKNAIKSNNIDTLPKPKEIEKLFKNIEKPYCIAAFVSQFSDNINLLYEYIYGRKNNLWFAKGIEYYERLGDLQGSNLLQCETALRSVCKILKKKCKKDNVKYLELRCSPINYTKGELSARDVVNIITQELENDDNCYFTLIFIASRHGDRKKIQQHIELAQEIFKDKKLKKWLVGFDLAGNESANPPEEFRNDFLPLMEQCLNITIHAGEGVDVENIWRAIYHLNADRIGHGLTLKNKPELIDRFIDRKIAIEMCPSSNSQIVGFRDYSIKETENLDEYPLKYYLDKGVYVTINTDDPGISLTDLTQEYYKAASMTKGGLSKWDILKIIRNGFRSAFVSHNIRKKLLLNAEKEIVEIIMKSYK